MNGSIPTPPPPSGDQPGGDTATVVALGRTLARTVRRLDRLDGDVADLAHRVVTLADRLGEPAEASKPPVLRSWLLVDDPDLAAEALADLTSWLWRVYLWYPDTWLASCWLWHPEVVEELWVLRLAHADAFDPDTGTPMRMSDWHDRQRPGVTTRVRGVLGKCELSRHVDRNGRGIDVTPPGPPAMASYADTVAAVWTAGAGLDVVRAAGPEPSSDQLAEADAYQRAHYRSHR
jgi:hypothetical protein